MLSWLPRWPYDVPPESSLGYWGEITSTLNWCEEDYYASPYAAEIVNTLTNFLFFYLGLRGIRNCLSQGHPRVFLVAFAGYLAVGVGSFAFHASLKYPMQLVDELSMIYTACLMCYITFEDDRTFLAQLALATGLAGLAGFISVYYHYLQNPAFHQNAYAILTSIVLFRMIYVMESTLRAPKVVSNKQHDPCEQRRRREISSKNGDILRMMWTMVAFGSTIFLTGFAIWGLDNRYCTTLRNWRHHLGLPWGVLLEGHGWWHLMTGTGGYFYIVWSIWLRYCLDGRQAEVQLRWPRLFTSYPDVVRSHAQSGPAAATHKKVL